MNAAVLPKSRLMSSSRRLNCSLTAPRVIGGVGFMIRRAFLKRPYAVNSLLGCVLSEDVCDASLEMLPNVV